MKLFSIVSNFVVVATTAVSIVAPVAAQEGNSEAFAGTPAEMELIKIFDTLRQQFEALFAEEQKITDPLKQYHFRRENDPLTQTVPRLLQFESEHQGTHVGLMALRCIVAFAASSGDPDSAAILGRRQAFQRLPNYADDPLLVETLRRVCSGAVEPSTEQLLRSLVENPNADDLVREFSKLILAEWMIRCLDSRDYLESRLQELRSGKEMVHPMEQHIHSRLLEIYATMPQMESWRSEALDLLREVAHSGHEMRQPAVKGIDPSHYLVRIDDQATQQMPRLSELAEGVLFKELHLRIGKPAPDLELTLVNEKTWSLQAQRGKVVIIMFSFEGCGPCEAMYPDLRELQKSYPDSLSILSIRADRNRQDTLDAVAEGKLTWNVHWDGRKGPLTTRWAVRGFPTVYVIDANGQVAGYNLRGQELRDKVAQLLDDRNPVKGVDSDRPL